MNQYLVDQIYDHHEYVRYISPRKLCYSYNVVEQYGLNDMIVCISEDGYKYNAEIYLSYYIFLIADERSE